MATNTCVLGILGIILISLTLVKSMNLDFPAVFNLGDSNSDTGALIAAGIESLYPPNGQTHFKVPSGRYSDGRLIIDFICIFILLLYICLIAPQIFIQVLGI